MVSAAAPTIAATAPVVAAAVAAPRPVSNRRRRRRSRRGPLIIGGLGFAAVILMVMVLANSSKQRDPASPPAAPPSVAVTPPTLRSPGGGTAPGPAGSDADADADADAAAFRVVDDPHLLWAPPSSGNPPALRLIPPGPQMVVVLRPRRLLQTAEGQQLLAALQPELGDTWQRVEQRSGIPAAQIEQLTLAITGSGDGWATASLAVQLSQPMPLGDLRQRWQADAAQTPEGATLFIGDDEQGDVRYVPQTALTDPTPVAAFAVGSMDQMREVAEIEGSAIPLPRQLQQLWDAASGDADLTMLAVPNFLFADGRHLLGHYAPRLVEPLRQLLIPDAAGLLVTSTLRPRWFVEVRLSPGAGSSGATLTRKLQLEVDRLPERAEQFLLASTPDPSWRAVALRLPQMMRAVDDYARFGIDDGQAVANLYLPSVAAPNVAVATVLAANTTPGGGAAVTTSPAAAAALTVEQMLNRPITVQFDQQSLEAAFGEILDALNSELPPSSKPLAGAIVGKDLEKDGITQNQPIRDFNEQQQPLRAVLTELVMRANPVTTVQSPTEPDQKLVWVVGPHPTSSNEQAILITTRAAAQGRYPLPAEFTSP